MKTVLITGTTSGIGKELALRFLSQNFMVIGISRHEAVISHPCYSHIVTDLADTAALPGIINQLKKDYSISILINNAGIAYYGPHYTISPQKIHEMTAVNLEAPMIITSLLLKQLSDNQGTIVNISSMTGKKRGNCHGVAYGATKAGLTSFGESLLDESRKLKIKVINIHPDLTDTNLYRNADFVPDDECGCALTVSDVADAVMYAVNTPAHLVVNDITLLPQAGRIKRKKS